MQINIVFFLVLSLFLTGCFKAPKANQHSGSGLAEFAAPDHDEPIFKKTIPLFQQTILHCPEKIWPGADWSSLNVLMIKKNQPAMMWHAKTNKFENYRADIIPPISYMTTFDFVKWEGDTILVLAPEAQPNHLDDPEGLFGVGLHEAFHTFVQKDWVKSERGRGTIYPVAYQPRFYRYMLFTHLKNYLLSRGADEKDLRKAAHWFKKWKTEYAHEVPHSMDRYEGTARYTEWLGRAVIEQGCTASAEQLLTSVLKQGEERSMGLHMLPDQFALDGEGYDVGGAAAFILGLIKKDKTWYALMKTQSPVEVLLSKVTPLAEDGDGKMEGLFKISQTRENRYIGKTLGSSLNNFSDKNYVRVALDGEPTPFGTRGFFIPASLDNVTAVPLGTELTVSGNDWKVTVKNDTVLFLPQISPCPAQFTALIPKSSLGGGTKKTVSLSTDGLNGTMRGSKTIDKQGFTWFCPEPSKNKDATITL